MGRVKTFRCPHCSMIWSTPKRRLWWRWLSPYHFNRIPCPDCYMRRTGTAER